MILPSFVLAYHGCDKQVAERILAGAEQVRVSTNDYDWLGPGAYFWENSVQRALDWASFLRARPSTTSGGEIREPFALGAIIDPGLCLDLTEAGDLTIFRESYVRVAEYFETIGEELPQNESAYAGNEDLVRRRLDCLVAEGLHAFREEDHLPAYDTLRAAFFEGSPLYPGTRITAKTHLQWCVRNPQRSIIGYFRPRLPQLPLAGADAPHLRTDS